MKKVTFKRKAFKKKLKDLLAADDFKFALKEISSYPKKKVINHLFSLLCSENELIRWRTITTMGIIVSRLANNNINSARVIMRRLMWSLNDESGGIGWGAPEAMAEIMARSPQLADEYHRILLSYCIPGLNYLEHDTLQKGVLWGIQRLSKIRPDLF